MEMVHAFLRILGRDLCQHVPRCHFWSHVIQLFDCPGCDDSFCQDVAASSGVDCCRNHPDAAQLFRLEHQRASALSIRGDCRPPSTLDLCSSRAPMVAWFNAIIICRLTIPFEDGLA